MIAARPSKRIKSIAFIGPISVNLEAKLVGFLAHSAFFILELVKSALERIIGDLRDHGDAFVAKSIYFGESGCFLEDLNKTN